MCTQWNVRSDAWWELVGEFETGNTKDSFQRWRESLRTSTRLRELTIATTTYLHLECTVPDKPTWFTKGSLFLCHGQGRVRKGFHNSSSWDRLYRALNRVKRTCKARGGLICLNVCVQDVPNGWKVNTPSFFQVVGVPIPSFKPWDPCHMGLHPNWTSGPPWNPRHRLPENSQGGQSIIVKASPISFPMSEALLALFHPSSSNPWVHLKLSIPNESTGHQS